MEEVAGGLPQSIIPLTPCSFKLQYNLENSVAIAYKSSFLVFKKPATGSGEQKRRSTLAERAGRKGMTSS